MTARGYKFKKQAGCSYVGPYAIYLGPLKVARRTRISHRRTGRASRFLRRGPSTGGRGFGDNPDRIRSEAAFATRSAHGNRLGHAQRRAALRGLPEPFHGDPAHTPPRNAGNDVSLGGTDFIGRSRQSALPREATGDSVGVSRVRAPVAERLIAGTKSAVIFRQNRGDGVRFRASHR